MDSSTQDRPLAPEVLFLLGKISDGELRAEVAKDPDLAVLISAEAGWDHYKAKIFETIARGYLNILNERRNYADEIFNLAVGLNRSLAQHVYGEVKS